MPLSCSACGQALGPTDRFCSSCGSPRPQFCTECGAPLPSEAKFCPQCGTRAAGPAAPAAPPAPAPLPLPELPPGLKEKFDSVRGELQGDRREVVVLFADVSGYTAMSETMDPEEVTILMNRLLQSLAEAVYLYEGYVDKFIGDAVMALFGAPLAHENDPERAILAGLAMQEVIERHNQSSQIPLALRVGINVGEVVAAHLGSEGQMQYTVLGDTVNVASRLEGKAEKGSVLVSQAVYDRVATRFSADELPPLELKGKSEPVRAYQIVEFLGNGAFRSQETSAPFVGREAELGALREFLSGIDGGGARAFLIEAEPGGGKTRLVHEALARLDTPVKVVSLSLSPIRLPGQRPPATELFSRLLPADEGLSPGERALSVMGPEAEDHRPGILDLARTLDPDSAPAPDPSFEADPAAARQNRWLALGALFIAVSRNQPVVAWIEDVHWIGEEAAELMTFLLHALDEAPVGFLLTSRTGFEVEWLPADAGRLHLEPLGEAAALELLGDLTRDLSLEQRRDLIRRSEGNPLFIEELVRAIRIQGEKGLAGIPSTVQGLIKSRIDRLPPPVQSLLHAAAVLGGRFPIPLLQRMYALEVLPLAFEASLYVLEDESFLTITGGLEGEGAFHHALMQEVAYSGLLLRVRRVLHESAARLGEEHYADHKEAEATFFAHHFWYADLKSEAVPYLWLAGRTAAEGFDLQLAEKYLSRAAEVVDQDSSLMPDVSERVRLEVTFGNVLLHRGALDAADERFLRLESLGEAEEREEWTARGREFRGRSAWYRGHLDMAQELFESGLALVSDSENRVAADLHNDLGVVFYYKNLPEEAFEQHSTSLEVRTRIDDKLGMAKSFNNIGNLMFEFRDDLDAAEQHYQRSLGLAEEIGNRQIICQALNNLGAVKRDRGEREEAIATFQRAEKLLEEMGWAHARYVNLQNQADCEISLGRIEEALEHLDACIRRGDDVLEPLNRINTRCLLFDAYFRAQADDLAEQALTDAERLQAELLGGEADRNVVLRKGRLLLAREQAHEAAEAFGRAAAIAERENQAADAMLARAHRRRALVLAGGPVDEALPQHQGNHKPRAALLAYLTADASARLDASPEIANSLGEVASMAAEMGDVALERSALEAQARILEASGRDDAAQAALQRAAVALARLQEKLPVEYRESFATHARNEALQKHSVA
jgi:class 3 adenylate cyclase/tetratricopeptide (TPR) repeat protein